MNSNHHKDSATPSSLDRLADFHQACVATAADEVDCSRDQFVILGSNTHQEYDEYDYVVETVWQEQKGRLLYTHAGSNHSPQHHYFMLGDMNFKGIVFLIVLAVALGVCAFFLYQFHKSHHLDDPKEQQQEQQPQQTDPFAAADHHQDTEQQATETTTTEDAVVTSTTVFTSSNNTASSETKAKMSIDKQKEEHEESSLSPLQKPQQQQGTTNDDAEEPDLVEEDSSKNNNIKKENNTACRRSPRSIPELQKQQPQHALMTVVTVPSTTVPTSNQLTAASSSSAVARHNGTDEITIQAVEKVLAVAKHLENRTGATLSLDTVLEQSLGQSRHEEKMRFKAQAELRHYEFEMNREAFKNDQTQARHDEKMAATKQDDAWLAKIKTCRREMLQTLLHEFMYTMYAFFAIHVIWHFFRLRQIWTFAGITSALYYSVCGQCSSDNIFQYEEPPPSYVTGYFSSYFPSSSSSWSSFSLLEFVTPAWLLQDLACTGMCGVKIILGLFGMIVTAMIVPAWMANYMAAGVVTITMLSNVFVWVPFIIGWEYMAGIYCCLGLGCYYYIEHVCRKSQGILQATDGTPCKQQVTTVVAKLDDVKEALQKHKFVLLGWAVVCFHYSALELERNHQFA